MTFRSGLVIMRTIALGVAFVAVLVTAVRVEAQSASAGSPEVAAQQYFELTRTENWAGIADATHPDALKRFQEILAPLVAADGTGELATLFGFPDAEAFKKAPAREVYVGLMKTISARAPALKQAITGMKVQVLGHVPEGADSAHVVYRGSAAALDMSMESIEVISFRRHEGTWRALLTRNVEGLAAALAGAAKR